MKSKTVFLQYLLLSFIAFVISGYFLSNYYDLPYPKPLGAQAEFTPNVQRGDINAISKNQPELILLGDSILYLGVDESAVAKKLDMKTYSIAVPGSGSAIWYLIFKNVILEATSHPKYVMILFRDTTLTLPSFRTTGYYFDVLDEFARYQEPLLMDLAFINAMSPAEKYTEQYLPLYSARWELRNGLDHLLRYGLSSAVSRCSENCVDQSMDTVFGEENIDAAAINQPVSDAAVLYTRAALDFKSQVGKSFLPAMIEMAQKNDITLIFVRTKNMTYPEYASEIPALSTYINSLKDYFSTQENVRFIDLAHDERIKAEYFTDSVHFNEEGKNIFTKILADQLMPLMK